MAPLDEYRSNNRDIWNRNADKNFTRGLSEQTGEYPLRRFLDDPEYISEDVRFDRASVGDVSGKTLLHLQCHIGTDTLSWARLGAEATGIDFSDRSIERARQLSNECGTPARFIEAELYDSPNRLSKKFDFVYTGIGALCWLPDIVKWAEVVSGFLKPGGTFYVRDGHPTLRTLDDERGDELRIVHPHFESAGVMTYPVNNRTEYEWPHGLGEIVTALIDAGLTIEFLQEHRSSGYRHLPQMVMGDDGLWRLPDENLVPLMFSLRAGKP